ncbi:MAG: hypothetical protein KC503_01650 [Myxococcales bacterium]|nr:hypothetical protein [Myxococcales bacterium]
MNSSISPALGVSVLLAYLAVMAWHAFRGGRATRDVSDYHVAGRSVSGVTIGLSFYATYMSTNSFVGHAGKSWSFGLLYTLIAPLFVVAAWSSWTFIGGPLRRRSEALGVISLAEYFGAAFASPSYRRAAAAVIVFASAPYLQAVFKGCALVLMQLTGLSMMPSLALVWLVVVGYTVAGGFHAVVKTDATQGIVMLVAALALPLAVVMHGGGLGATLAATARAAKVDGVGGLLLIGDLGVLLGIGIAGGFKMLSEPRQLSRFFAIDQTQLRIGRLVALATLLFSYSLLLPVGLLARGMISTLEHGTDGIVPQLLARGDVLPSLASVLVLAALLSAAMSSIDSVLLVVSAAIQRDLLGWTDGRGPLPELTMTRVWIVLYSVIPAVLVLVLEGGIVELTTYSGAIYGAVFLPPLIYSLRGDDDLARAPAAPAWTSLLVGAALVPLWAHGVRRWIPALRPVHQVVASAVGSFFAYAIAARYSSARAAARLRR